MEDLHDTFLKALCYKSLTNKDTLKKSKIDQGILM